MTTRRAVQREQTRDEIKAIARQQMAEGGAASLSLNAIAKQLGMVVSGLYRYYDSRDALITALIIDAFNAHADAMQSAADQHPADDYPNRLLAALLAYRGWALANKAEFSLVYGTPIPGYVAPREQTLPAASRAMTVVYTILLGADAAGMLRPTALHQPSFALVDTSVPPHIAYIGAVGWARLHGIVTLEVFEHLQGLVSDIDGLYHAECLRLFEEAGLPLTP